MKFRTRRSWTLLAVVLLAGAAGPGWAEEYVLPVFAWQLAGKNGNLWSSELYVTNPGSEARRIWVAGFLAGRQGTQRPCLPPVGQLVVPPQATVLWPATAVSRDLGCPSWALGGLRLESDGSLSIASRVVNERAAGDGESVLLRGFGQEIMATPVADPGSTMEALLPALAWHPNPCGERLFESYVYVANPGLAAVTVTVQQDAAGTPGTLIVNGVEVATPVPLTVEPGAWLQLKVDPVDSPLAVCMAPELASLVVKADGPVAVIGSVVDRSTQDPRTVTAVELEY